MAKTAKRALCALLAALLLFGSVGAATAFAAPAFDNAEAMNVIVPKLVSPAGKDFPLASTNDVYSFEAPWTGRFRVRTNSSFGIYPNFWRWADSLGNFPGSDFLFKFLMALLDLPNYMINFLLNVLIDAVFPYTKPTLALYDSDYNLIAEAERSGFALFYLKGIGSRFDIRFNASLEQGKTYYLVMGNDGTTFDLPYFLSIWPWL